MRSYRFAVLLLTIVLASLTVAFTADHASQLGDHGTQSAEQTMSHIVSNNRCVFSWSEAEVLSGRERRWPTTSAAGRRPSRPTRATTRDKRPRERARSSGRRSSRRV